MLTIGINYKKIIIALALIVLVLVVGAHQVGAAPADSVIEGAVGVGGGGDADTKVTNTVQAAVNILTWVVGVIALIMIILNGLKYITSQGDPSKTASARNGILYAITGIVIVSLAQVLVRLVISST